MSPAVPPPGTEDVDMWSQIFAAARQVLLSGILWAQMHGPVLALAGFTAWLFGLERGVKGKSLKVVVASGMLFAYVFTPIAMHYLGLVAELWKSAVVVFLSVSAWRVIKWVEMLMLRHLGLDRRKMPFDHEKQENFEDE